MDTPSPSAAKTHVEGCASPLDALWLRERARKEGERKVDYIGVPVEVGK